MAPPTGPLNLDVEAISGICGYISIAAWIVVFSPQIAENFRRGSAEGLSLQFIIIWLVGDVFNILGAILQGVLPTMLILAIYYTIADMVLLGQCFYYKGFTWKDEIPPPKPKTPRVRATGEANERTGLLDAHLVNSRERRGSTHSWHSWEHLSPAVPMIPGAPTTPPPPPTKLRTLFTHTTAILMVCVAGVAGWYLSRHAAGEHASEPSNGGPQFNLWGQIFGWMCALLYLGSRLPQLLLNWRRKSVEGISMLFFLFSCLGNLTYVLSIFAYEPTCAHAGHCQPGEASDIYGRYILVNASWIAGSLGTLFLDLGIFVQFFIYSDVNSDEDDDTYVEDAESSGGDEERWDQRPILERVGSGAP
ncbi:PQ loop repeat-domain-containing protein [Apiospora saccharicola]|uniref:PQ loop repeat-domain-containing protein n=1 Tax=Apiospora saccharicola TaxID=335842 RepID=A0ABR1WMJ4_9PEZI